MQKIESAFDGKSIEYKSNGSTKSSIEQYLKKIKSYLRDLIDNNHKASGA